MSNHLVSSETADRNKAAAEFIEAHGPSLRFSQKTAPYAESTVRPNARGVLMETLASFNNAVWVQLKARAPQWKGFLIRPNRGDDEDEFADATDFELTVTTAAGSFPIVVSTTATAGTLTTQIISGAGLNPDHVIVHLGENAPNPDSGTNDVDAWYVSIHLTAGVESMSVAEEFMEVIEDDDTPIFSEIVEAYKFNDQPTLSPGTVVSLMDVGERYAIIASFEVAPTTETPVSPDGGCGGCSTPSGYKLIDVGDGFLVPSHFTWSPICGGLLLITFVWQSGTTWEPSAPVLLLCGDDEDPIAATVSLEITGPAAETGAIITMTIGSDTWTWVNDTTFIADWDNLMRRISGPVDCPCNNWIPYPCLRPADICDCTLVTGDKTITLADLEAPYTDYNGEYTLEKTTGCTWSGTNSNDEEFTIEFSGDNANASFTDDIAIYTAVGTANACRDSVTLTKQSGPGEFPEIITVSRP